MKSELRRMLGVMLLVGVMFGFAKAPVGVLGEDEPEGGSLKVKTNPAVPTTVSVN